jgi:hypothetical protein
MTGLLIALLWFPLLGAAFSRLAGRTSWFLAGAGVNGLALYVAGVLHVPLKPMIAVLGLAAIVVLSRVAGREGLAPNTSTPGEGTSSGSILSAPRRSRLGMAAPLYLTAAVLLFGAVVTPLADYDGRAFWLLKAKAIAHEQRIDGPFFQLKTAYSPRNQYPLLVPLDAATAMMFAGDGDDRHTRAMFALFGIALAFELRRRFARWFSPSTAVWLATLLLWLPEIETANGGALSAGCDVPLAAFAGCAFFELIDRRAFHFGFWLACLALTKSEGLPFALVLFVAGVFVFRTRIVRAAIPFAIALATLFAWRARVVPTDESDFIAQLRELPQHIGRAGEALHAFLPWFGVLWIGVLGAIFVLAWKRAWRPLAPGLAAILPMLAIYFLAYVVTDWTIAELVRVTASRLLSHFVVPALFLIAAALHVSQSSRWEPFEPSQAPSSPRA